MGEAKAVRIHSRRESDAASPQDDSPIEHSTEQDKQTIADFLAEAAEMEEGDWEEQWHAACRESSRRLRAEHDCGRPVVGAERLFSRERVLEREARLRRLVEAHALERGWSPGARRLWETALPFLARAFELDACASEDDRFGIALARFSERGCCRIDLEGTGEGARCWLDLAGGRIELCERAYERFAPLLRQQLESLNLPFVSWRHEEAIPQADGRRLVHRVIFSVNAPVA